MDLAALKVFGILNDVESVKDIPPILSRLREILGKIPSDTRIEDLLISKNLDELIDDPLSCQKKTFSSLPPRLVIECVLPFIALNPLSQFDCFGYFMKDRMRYIWNIFKSIELNDETTPKYMIFDFKKVTFLRLNNFQYPLALKYSNMNSLTHLMVENCERIDDKFLCGRPRFNNLYKLDLFYNPNVRGEDWSAAMVSNLVHLSIVECWNFSDELFKKRHLKKLQNLRLHKLPRITGVEWNKIEKVKSISVAGCENFKDYIFRNQNFPNLRYLMLKENENLKGTKWKKLGDVREMIIDDCVSFKQDIFQKKKFPNLEVLVLGYLNFDGKYWNDFRSLKVLQITTCDIPDYFFQLHTFPDLVYLKITCDFLKGYGWIDGFKKIRKLNICSLSIKDRIFQTKIFQNIEELEISSCIKLKGENWKEFKKLKILIVNFHGFGDGFFRKYNFISELSMLKINSPVAKLKGKKWKKLNNLISLNLESCFTMNDNFFREQTFVNLRKLNISSNSSLSGAKWGTIKNLRFLKLYCCNLFTDSFFQQNSLEEVEKIQLYETPKIKGVGWKNLKNLKVLNIDSCNYFVDEIFSKEMPNLEKLFLKKNAKIYGRKWSFFPKLRSLGIKNQRFSTDMFEKYTFPHLDTLKLINVHNLQRNGKKLKKRKNIHKKIRLIKKTLIEHERDSYMKNLRKLKLESCNFGDYIKERVNVDVNECK